jgi:hypothetical protein
MKIVTVGAVILTENKIAVEGWLVERDETDPPLSEATNEQLLLEVAIPWAQKRMNAAIGMELKRVGASRKAATQNEIDALPNQA